MPTYTKEFVAQQLAADNKWLIRGILAIYARQTDAERCAGLTKEHNGMGFNGVDSPILSSFAEQIKNWDSLNPTHRRFPTPLSTRQTTVARKLMLKYARQLSEIANANEQKRAATTTIHNDDYDR